MKESNKIKSAAKPLAPDLIRGHHPSILNPQSSILNPSLYIVATPIGNLGDITFRAVDILKTVDLIAAEDTRHSRFLLQNYSIKTPCISLHEHNESFRVQKILSLLKEGKSIALISDAGTPLISDPGYQLVHQIKEMGFNVVPIPGSSALIAALSASGLPTDRFCFEGFLPAKTTARKKILDDLKTEKRTMVFYESTHRIKESLLDMKDIFGNERKAVVAKELTKQFETIKTGVFDELLSWLDSDAHYCKGEFVIIVSGAPSEKSEITEADKKILQILREELPANQAAKLAAKITGKRKNVLYTHCT